MDAVTLKGSCLCGDIRFMVTGTPGGISACHCGQCRRQSGHVWASAHVPEREIAIEGAPVWYRSSEGARRGFCPRCGSFLFWKADDEEKISFALGAIDGPTGLRLEKHIFTAWKGDYYEIGDDGVPRE